jgi:translin
MEANNSAREQALRQCRETIRASAVTIRAVHRLEFDEALRLLAIARGSASGVRATLVGFPALLNAGYVHDSEKEFVEATAVYAIVRGEEVPPPEELGVGPAAYLNGLAEAGSECRRYVLDRLREGELEEADRVLRIMDDIYYELITFDFPDAITGNLRRTTDAFRAVLERTRGDLTLTMQQRALEQALRSMIDARDDHE